MVSSQRAVLCLLQGLLLVALVGLAGQSPAAANEGRTEGQTTRPDTAAPTITHGPILGRPSATGMGVWVRTSRPTRFEVQYHPKGNADTQQTATGRTRRAHDNTGWVHLTDLTPDTRYAYRVRPVSGDTAARLGTFRTWPSPSDRRHPEHNPEGLFNFSFEIGACNFQYRRGDSSYAMPAYRSMRWQIEDEVDFQIMNGDYIYEARRGTTVDEWRSAHGVPPKETPRVLRTLPDVTGMWANYRLYLDRSTHLKRWHRHVPTFFMFDDHELLNDINGAGTPGHEDPRVLARDPGVRAWQDYLGWSNPLPDTTRPVYFGRAELTPEGVLTDPEADFRGLRPPHEPTLHVHSNGDHSASGVYGLEGVLGPHRLQLTPAPDSGGTELAYSIGRRAYYDFQVANAHFFVLDTRSHRDLHDKDRPAKEGVQMLGTRQKRWLKTGMRRSDAEVFFVVSSVSLTIPHVSEAKPNKDESWTSYLDVREELIDFWDRQDAPVFVLTGDLHNSMAIGVTDNVREYVASPHNSPNHTLSEEDGRPPSGAFDSNGRPVNIHWSSFWKKDVPDRYRQQPYYTVVSVQNVFKNPGPGTEDRWVAYPTPRVIIRFYDGLTGDLAYAESVPIGESAGSASK